MLFVARGALIERECFFNLKTNNEQPTTANNYYVQIFKKNNRPPDCNHCINPPVSVTYSFNHYPAANR